MTRDVLPWERARHLPWHVFTSPLEKWASQPTFVLGEYLFIACAAAALYHALRQGEERRKHVLVWALALLAGTANDVIFMALPLVDNFWQAQATIMITPRLPLYIPCVYICFMYFPTVSAWRIGLPPWPRAALSGLAASAFYAPYDIVGAKFLWWTWHDADPPIARRLLGAPIGSTIWTITFVAAFSLLAGRALDRDPAVSGRTIAKAVAMVCGLSTLLMVVQMTALQQLDGGTPGLRGLVVLVAIYAGIVAFGLRKAAVAHGAGPRGLRPADRVLLAAVLIHFAALIGLGVGFDPATHRSTSLHQTVGPCDVLEKDITGASRRKYLCVEDFDEDFSLACLPAPPESGSVWYTVCGRGHRGFAGWMAGVAGLGVFGALVYSYMLGAFRRRRGRVSTQAAAASAEHARDPV
jgi:hypothetical protein